MLSDYIKVFSPLATLEFGQFTFVHTAFPTEYVSTYLLHLCSEGNGETFLEICKKKAFLFINELTVNQTCCWCRCTNLDQPWFDGEITTFSEFCHFGKNRYWCNWMDSDNDGPSVCMHFSLYMINRTEVHSCSAVAFITLAWVATGLETGQSVSPHGKREGRITSLRFFKNM
jgi:hypothetical protein